MTATIETKAGNLFMTGASRDEVWPLIRDFHYSARMPSIIHHCFAWRKEGGLFGDTGELQAVRARCNPARSLQTPKNPHNPSPNKTRWTYKPQHLALSLDNVPNIGEIRISTL